MNDSNIKWYELLNPNDEDVLTFVTDVDAPLSVFAKAEGLKVKFVQESYLASKKLGDFLGVALLITSVVSSAIALFSAIGLLVLRLRKNASRPE